jgi:hypothetical protein
VAHQIIFNALFTIMNMDSLLKIHHLAFNVAALIPETAYRQIRSLIYQMVARGASFYEAKEALCRATQRISADRQGNM